MKTHCQEVSLSTMIDRAKKRASTFKDRGEAPGSWSNHNACGRADPARFLRAPMVSLCGCTVEAYRGSWWLQPLSSSCPCLGEQDKLESYRWDASL